MFKRINYIFIVVLFISCEMNNASNDEGSKTNIQQIVDTNVNEEMSLSELEQEIINNPKSSNPYYKRAIYYKKKQEYILAIEDINRALNLSPDASMLNYEKASLLYDYGLNQADQSMIDNAKIYLDQAMQLDQDNYDAYLLKAEILIDLKDSLESMNLVQHVIKNDETNARAYYLKGLIYDFLYFRNKEMNYSVSKSNRDMDRAISSYQTAIELEPSLFDPYIYISMLFEMKNDDRAIIYLEKALELNPDSFEAIRNLGLFYHFTYRYNEAQIYFKKMLEIDSTFVEAYFNIGNTYIGMYTDNMDQYSKDTTLQKASYYFDKAIELFPEYVQAIHNRGVVYEFQGKKDKAREFYLKAIDLDNNYMPSLDAINSM